MAVEAIPEAPQWVTPKDGAARMGLSLDWFYVLLARGEYDAQRVSDNGEWRVFVDARGWPRRARLGWVARWTRDNRY